MNELILENIGIIVYLAGCITCFFLLDKKKFDYVIVIFILLSWVSLAFSLMTMKDNQYKQLEDREK